MFGYVQYDLPNLCVKDLMLYRALYCGLCKGIAASSGQLARTGLSYDITFLSALLHNMMGVDIVIEQQNCFEHAIRKRPIAKVDALTEELGALNTLLVYHKLSDDTADEGKGGGKRLLFRGGYRRAKARFPALEETVSRYLSRQGECERGKEASFDRAAEPSALFLRELGEHFLADMGTPDALGLFYDIGKWIYLVDAADDYEKDGKKGSYNPFVCAYGKGTRQDLSERHGEELAFLFDTLFYSMREHLAGVTFHFNRDLTDNVILRGIPLETMRVLKGEPRREMSVKV